MDAIDRSHSTFLASPKEATDYFPSTFAADKNFGLLGKLVHQRTLQEKDSKLASQVGNSLMASLESKVMSDESERRSPGPAYVKKNTIGVSALLAFNNNQGYTFEPLKKYKAEDVFFGIEEKKPLTPPAEVAEEKPPTPPPEPLKRKTTIRRPRTSLIEEWGDKSSSESASRNSQGKKFIKKATMIFRKKTVERQKEDKGAADGEE